MENLDLMYFDLMSRYDVLSKEDEADLFSSLSLGDKTARETLLYSNLKLCYKIASKYKYLVDINDLMSCGTETLLKSIDSFDCSNGYAFSTYATRALELAFKRYINNSKMVRLPERKIADLLSVKNKIDKESIKAGHLLDEYEISNLLTKKEYELYQYSQTSVCSMDANISKDGESTFCDMIEGDSFNYEEKTDNQNIIDKICMYVSLRYNNIESEMFNDHINGYSTKELVEKYCCDYDEVKNTISTINNDVRKAFAY